ncbi:Uncharacterised protein [Zhongshania aliphaticivorans]|nr:hypothetical protein [Zhongshania aliphaticivorans]CAA0102605.1 Uncharacterised protein [Zhongshania aliphaticivorans]
MTHHIKGQSRHQSTFFPEVIDNFVTEDNPVRVIDFFVDQLDLLSLGFESVTAKQLVVQDQVSKQRHSLRSPGYPIGVGYDEVLKNFPLTVEIAFTKIIPAATNPFSTAEHCSK